MAGRVLAASLLLFTIAPHRPAQAWNAVGHMTIAAIAEPRLSARAKREIEALLPLVADPRTPTFLTAGVWMDDIRADGVRLFDRWHYDNLGHSPDGTPLGPRHTDNVAWAVETNVRALQNEKVSLPEKARALRFLMHTAQDAHNPLHCGSRFTKDDPTGDSGGNGFRLGDGTGNGAGNEAGQGPRNLHALWDGALGTFGRTNGGGNETRLESEVRLRALAVTLAVKYPEASLSQSAVLDPQKWVEEGSALLKDGVYPLTASPNATYFERFRPVAERQATLAGYRLARLLNTIWP
jgi:hypothetical protein